MKKTTLLGLTLSSVLFIPVASADVSCSPENPAACKSKLEQECRYYLMDDYDMDEMEEGDSFFDRDDHDDDERSEGSIDTLESDLLISDLESLNLTAEQKTLMTQWQNYNKRFDDEWVNLCVSHPNKDKSLAGQLDWDEANLKVELGYIQESRAFVEKVNASLTPEQKQQLVQLGLMQLLP